MQLSRLVNVSARVAGTRSRRKKSALLSECLRAVPRDEVGLALRFARVKRYRDDKGPGEAGTIDTVRELHARESGLDLS